MKSITIHGVDDPLAELIKSRAKEEGLSINKTVKKLLEESLGVRPANSGRNRHNFEEFCGVWSESEHKEFDVNTRELREIDPEEWQ